MRAASRELVAAAAAALQLVCKAKLLSRTAPKRQVACRHLTGVRVREPRGVGRSARTAGLPQGNISASLTPLGSVILSRLWLPHHTLSRQQSATCHLRTYQARPASSARPQGTIKRPGASPSAAPICPSGLSALRDRRGHGRQRPGAEALRHYYHLQSQRCAPCSPRPPPPLPTLTRARSPAPWPSAPQTHKRLGGDGHHDEP